MITFRLLVLELNDYIIRGMGLAGGNKRKYATVIQNGTILKAIIR